MKDHPFIKQVPVEHAIGRVLGHDITRIVPGEFKGAAFKKGHIVAENDVPHLLDMGKKHIYVLHLENGIIHENEAAGRIAKGVAGQGIRFSDPSEGRINLVTSGQGLLKIKVDALKAINSITNITLATIHGNQTVADGTVVAGTRIIPLVINAEVLEAVEAICREHFPIIEVVPFRPYQVGVITTGTEIYSGRIRDQFGPVLKKKIGALGSHLMRQVFVSDEIDLTVSAIHQLIKAGAELIALTGGMSVDPDDQTPASIRAAGGEIVTYGAPVFPGAMFMLAYLEDIPIVGLPGCVMYYRSSIFDLVFPRILAGERLTRDHIVSLGYGGFCSGCDTCRYPVCGFGKHT